MANALRAQHASRVLDAIKDVGPAIKGLAAREMGLQHGPGALTHGSDTASRNANDGFEGALW